MDTDLQSIAFSSSPLSFLHSDLLRKICKKNIFSLADVFSFSSASSHIRNTMWQDDRLWQYLYQKKWAGFPHPKKNAALSWHHLYLNYKKWDVNALNTIKTVNEHTRGVTSLCLDQNYLFSGSHDTTIKVYSNSTLNCIASLEGHQYTIWALASDNNTLYSGSNDHTIKVWDLESLSCKHTLTEHQSKIFGLEIKDNALFSSGDKIVKVWDRGTHSPVATLSGHTAGINAILIMPTPGSHSSGGGGGDHLVTGSSDKSLRIWDVHTMQCQQTLTSDNTILSLAATDHTMFTGHESCIVKMWDTRMGTVVGMGTVHQWQVWQLALAGGYLFAGSFDHKISSWDIRASLAHVGTYTGHRSYIHALTADTDRLFSGSADKSIRIWSNNTVAPQSPT